MLPEESPSLEVVPSLAPLEAELDAMLLLSTVDSVDCCSDDAEDEASDEESTVASELAGDENRGDDCKILNESVYCTIQHFQYVIFRNNTDVTVLFQKLIPLLAIFFAKFHKLISCWMNLTTLKF